LKFDPDGSQSISWYEFDKALKDIGVNISLAELEHLMEIFDTDGDGELHWGEFVDWVDDRVPLTLEKMRKIISAHEGNAAKRGSKFAAVKGPSPAYMKEWLKVHGENVIENVAAIAKQSRAHGTMSPLGGNVKLLGDSKKVEQALKKRKASRAEVIEGLRVAVMSKAAADVPLKQQLDMVWARFDVNGDGIINWKEFASGMKSMGMEFSPQELSAIMKEFDTNCDGALDYVEFVGHLLPTTSTTVEEDFERLTAARRSMLQVRGISRAGVPNATMKK
jgi:Ca2+-binding EF-hand superfamily protein